MSELPGLSEYVEAIEAHFRNHRGADHVLNPRDFALARSWHRAGLPLAAVLLGIDRAFAADAKLAALSLCRRQVEELAVPGPRPQPPAGGGQRVPLAELQQMLGLLEERLRGLPPVSRAAFTLALRRLSELQDLVAVASRPNWDYVKNKLREIDDAVSGAVLGALTAEAAARIRAESVQAAARHRGRVDPVSLEDAISRLAVQRARAGLGLPRVSIG